MLKANYKTWYKKYKTNSAPDLLIVEEVNNIEMCLCDSFFDGWMCGCANGRIHWGYEAFFHLFLFSIYYYSSLLRQLFVRDRAQISYQ